MNVLGRTGERKPPSQSYSFFFTMFMFFTSVTISPLRRSPSRRKYAAYHDHRDFRLVFLDIAYLLLMLFSSVKVAVVVFFSEREREREREGEGEREREREREWVGRVGRKGKERE